jgi:hypothetical protein
MRFAILILLVVGCGHANVRPGTNVNPGIDNPNTTPPPSPVRIGPRS